MTPFEQAERNLRLRNVILRRLPCEFEVSCRASTFVSPDLDEVVAAGERMAEELAARPPTPTKRRSKSIWSKWPKYARRSQIRSLNRKRLRAKWAGRGRLG